VNFLQALAGDGDATFKQQLVAKAYFHDCSSRSNVFKELKDFVHITENSSGESTKKF